MKIGLYFGSFNPIHIGHLALANYMVEYAPIDQLWFVVSPHNPLKKKSTLLADQYRLEMVELAIEKDTRFRACDVEFRMPQPSYTIDTLAYLTEKYPMHEFSIIMGSDGLNTFDKWKNADQIVERHTRLVYPRHGDEHFDYTRHKNILVYENAPKIEISSSFIRQAIKEGKQVKYFLSEPVWEFIDRGGFYG